ncbi:MAG: hypothetical protein EPN47_16050 [Acidobacteria bacterium]|nr:MAG: hypothetical protein EPN47_16050 [Acidobacteriota bacterium]
MSPRADEFNEPSGTGAYSSPRLLPGRTPVKPHSKVLSPLREERLVDSSGRQDEPEQEPKTRHDHSFGNHYRLARLLQITASEHGTARSNQLMCNFPLEVSETICNPLRFITSLPGSLARSPTIRGPYNRDDQKLDGGQIQAATARN